MKKKKKRNHSAGCIGLCTAINKAACTRGRKNSAVNPLESAGRAWEQAKWAIDTTPTSWPAASRLVLSRRWLWSAAPKLVRRGAAVLLHNTTLQPAGAYSYLTRPFHRVGKRQSRPLSAKKKKKKRLIYATVLCRWCFGAWVWCTRLIFKHQVGQPWLRLSAKSTFCFFYAGFLWGKKENHSISPESYPELMECGVFLCSEIFSLQ